MAAVSNFMTSALVTWVKTFQKEGEKELDYQDLCDGIFLNEVMQHIDPRPNTEKYSISRPVEDVSGRLQNWDILLKALKSYYQDVLQQLVVMEAPNILTICREPDTEASINELQKALLMILGCAVQCEQKEDFIEIIKSLDIEVQHAMVVHIKEITDDTDNILPAEILPEETDAMTRSVQFYLQRLIDERDQYFKDLAKATIENDYFQSQLESARLSHVPSSPATPEKHHLGVELAESKAKLRRMRQELEEKNELVSELKDELEENKIVLSKLRHENLQLTQDARAARTYRDEVDVLREKASRVEKCDAEISRYKEKLNELEFYKARVDELREDNKILVETKTMLEEQLSNSHRRVETVIELENELMRYKQRVEELYTERDVDKKRIQELAEENARLEFEKKSSMNTSANLEQELSQARAEMNTGLSSTLSDQMNDTANSKILRLELENQRLKQQVEELKQKTMVENFDQILELEKENGRLQKRVDKLQEAYGRESKTVKDLEQEALELRREKEELKQNVENVKVSSDRQIKGLQKENEQLSQSVATLRERCEKSGDMRNKEIEKENERMHRNKKEMTTYITRLEYDNRHLQQNIAKLKDKIDRADQVQEDNTAINKQNKDLHKTVATLTLSVDKMDTLDYKVTDLSVENRRLELVIQDLKKDRKKMEKVEKENLDLTVENKRLQRTVDLMKNSRSKVVTPSDSEEPIVEREDSVHSPVPLSPLPSAQEEELKRQLDEKEKELGELKDTVEAIKIDKGKYDQLEVDLLDLDTENHKLQKSLEAANVTVEEVRKEVSDLENENQKLHKTIETLRVSVKKLEGLEKDNRDLETENKDLSRESSSHEKENKRLRQTLSMKENLVDELSGKLSEVERENKSMKKNMDRSRESSSRVKELEKENMDMLQQATMDKKTLATLREDLVNEKIKTQQLSNELEKLRQDLERIGINKEKLVMAEQAQDESKYKALESMMEDALKQSSQIKEEKIQALESRLEESKNRNRKLQEELKSVKKEREALKQRLEEESAVPAEEGVPSRNKSLSLERAQVSATKEILQLKDHLVDVERANATLIAENKNIKAQTKSVQERLHQMETQNSNLQSQVTSLQQQSSGMQSENAKLQVEATTLQSQSASLMLQNTTLQNQYSTLEADHQQLRSDMDELQNAHEQLVMDHEALQQLHEQLTSEYEALISEHGSLKSNHKALRAEYQELSKLQESLVSEKAQIDELKQKLQKEKDEVQSEHRTLGGLESEHKNLKMEHERLTLSKTQVEREYHNVMVEYKTVKTDYNQLKLKHTELQGDMADCKDQLNAMDVEVSKMANRCEALSHMNNKLEEENKQLISQVQQLIQQNQELLMQTLESKEHYHEESRQYMDQLSDLRRQKEKLEEKIMEQYKNYDRSPKKNRGFGAQLVRKARGFISRRKRENERTERPRSAIIEHSGHHGDSPGDNSSLGSFGDSIEGAEVTLVGIRKTAAEDGYMQQKMRDWESAKLSKHSRNLAKSTTALNYENYNGQFTMRGSKSSEDLLNIDTPRSARSDGGQADVESLSSSNASWHFLTQPRNKKKGPRHRKRMTLAGIFYPYTYTGSYELPNNQNNLSSSHGQMGTPNRGRQGSISSEDNIPTRDMGLHSGEAPLDSSLQPRFTPRLSAWEPSADSPNDSPRIPGQEDSLGSEEITLEQFLEEANKNTPPAVALEDTRGKNSMKMNNEQDHEKVLNRPTPVRPSPREDPSMKRFSSHMPDLQHGSHKMPMNISKNAYVSMPNLNDSDDSPREGITPKKYGENKTSTPTGMSQSNSNTPFTIRSFAERQRNTLEHEPNSTPAVKDIVSQYNKLDQGSPSNFPQRGRTVSAERQAADRLDRLTTQPYGINLNDNNRGYKNDLSFISGQKTDYEVDMGSRGRGYSNGTSDARSYSTSSDQSNDSRGYGDAKSGQDGEKPHVPVAPPRRLRDGMSPRREKQRAPSPPRSAHSSTKRRAPSPPVKQPSDISSPRTDPPNTPNSQSAASMLGIRTPHSHMHPHGCKSDCYLTPYVRMTGFKSDNDRKNSSETTSPRTPNNTAPNSTQSPPGGKDGGTSPEGKNSVWYEYGCV